MVTVFFIQMFLTLFSDSLSHRKQIFLKTNLSSGKKIKITICELSTANNTEAEEKAKAGNN